MFKEEAEKRYPIRLGIQDELRSAPQRYAWKNGAEYGYKLAHEEMEAQGLALQSDTEKTIEQNIQLKEEITELKKELTNTTSIASYQQDSNMKRHFIIEEAKTIIKDLLDNSDEYARQRAFDFLKEVDNV